MSLDSAAAASAEPSAPAAPLSLVRSSPQGEPLADRAKRWRKALQDADTGYNVIAREVLQVVDDWERYKADAGGMTPSAWLRRTFGKGKDAQFFRVRDDAVTKFGESSRRTMHHDVLKWAGAIVPASMRQKVKDILTAARKENGNNCLTLAQARPLVLAIIGPRSKRTKTCSRCETLAAFILSKGLEVPQ